ncbi:hypothetical protein ACTXT7_015251 [Hymenolepis weldensis]
MGAFILKKLVHLTYFPGTFDLQLRTNGKSKQRLESKLIPYRLGEQISSRDDKKEGHSKRTLMHIRSTGRNIPKEINGIKKNKPPTKEFVESTARSHTQTKIY